MQNKRAVDNFTRPESEFLISVMDRHNDWCVIVCLIGGGQEINKGEASLLEWFSAIKKQFNHCQVYVSNEISDSQEDLIYKIYSRDSKHRFDHQVKILQNYKDMATKLFLDHLYDIIK
jgi:hypothetical protein